MRFFAMTDGINEETLSKFIPFFNQYRSEPCTIVLHSRGGSTYITETILHMISQMEDCTLLIHAVYSAAFEIAVCAKCKKILSKYARGMWHLGRLDASIALDHKPYYDEDVNTAKNFAIERKVSDKMARRIMTDEEYKSYKKRDEVWFCFKRMREIIPDAVVI